MLQKKWDEVYYLSRKSQHVKKEKKSSIKMRELLAKKFFF